MLSGSDWKEFPQSLHSRYVYATGLAVCWNGERLNFVQSNEITDGFPIDAKLLCCLRKGGEVFVFHCNLLGALFDSAQQ